MLVTSGLYILRPKCENMITMTIDPKNYYMNFEYSNVISLQEVWINEFKQDIY